MHMDRDNLQTHRKALRQAKLSGWDLSEKALGGKEKSAPELSKAFCGMDGRKKKTVFSFRQEGL